MFNLLRYKFWKHTTLYKKGKYNEKDYYIFDGNFRLSSASYKKTQSDFEQRCKRISEIETQAPFMAMSCKNIYCSYISDKPILKSKLYMVN